jgi:cell division protease FtsH
LNNSANKAAPKWGNWLYIIIPAMLIIGMAFAVGGKATNEKPEYYEIVSSFRTDKVSEFNLDLSNGKLEYKLKGEDKLLSYNVPNVDIFVNDIHDYVTEYNIKNP